MKSGISNLADGIARHLAGALPAALVILFATLAGGSAVAQITSSTALPVPAPPPGAPKAPAEKFDRSKGSLGKLPSAADVKPNGPVTVTARSAELVQGASAVYIGNVVLNSNTLKLDGDRAELQQFPNSQYTAKITGVPAHMNHAGTGPDNPPIVARAKTVNYDSRNGGLDLVGDACVKRGTDVITGETIHYDVNERRIQAAGGGDTGQVTFVIQPQSVADAPASADNKPTECPAFVATVVPAAPAPAAKKP